MHMHPHHCRRRHASHHDHAARRLRASAPSLQSFASAPPHARAGDKHLDIEVPCVAVSPAAAAAAAAAAVAGAMLASSSTPRARHAAWSSHRHSSDSKRLLSKQGLELAVGHKQRLVVLPPQQRITHRTRRRGRRAHLRQVKVFFEGSMRDFVHRSACMESMLKSKPFCALGARKMNSSRGTAGGERACQG
jgi:hypothetical protein